MESVWTAESKFELIMEVWEKLDCEDVGRAEIEAIRIVVDEVYALSPEDSPMKLARLLADEGAVLRHEEILKLDVEVRVAADDVPLTSGAIDISSRESVLTKLRQLNEEVPSMSKSALKDLRSNVMRSRDLSKEIAGNPDKTDGSRQEASEIAEWLSIWLQSPEMFETWITARLNK